MRKSTRNGRSARFLSGVNVDGRGNIEAASPLPI